MSLVGRAARNHPQQKVNPKVDDRQTAPEVFDPLHERFGFTVDAAASPHNAKLPRYWTMADDGLAQLWVGERVWYNPPYSSIEPWVRKAWEPGPELVVMLVPANRTEQVWWQDWVEPHRDGRRPGSALTVEFLRGRIRFIAHDDTEIRPNVRPPFGCCLLIWTYE